MTSSDFWRAISAWGEDMASRSMMFVLLKGPPSIEVLSAIVNSSFVSAMRLPLSYIVMYILSFQLLRHFIFGIYWHDGKGREFGKMAM